MLAGPLSVCPPGSGSRENLFWSAGTPGKIIFKPNKTHLAVNSLRVLVAKNKIRHAVFNI